MLKRRISEIALNECVSELRAACRRPIDESALDAFIAGLRPNFEHILDNSEGGKRWADAGRRMRDNGRYLGSLADFLAHRADEPVVRDAALTEAFNMVRDACTLRVSRDDEGKDRSSSAAQSSRV